MYVSSLQVKYSKQFTKRSNDQNNNICMGYFHFISNNLENLTEKG